jgi:hypothetical protein
MYSFLIFFVPPENIFSKKCRICIRIVPFFSPSNMAFEALKELQTLQELEQKLDLELQQALELKQALEFQYHAELEVDSGTTYVPNPNHDEKLLQPGLQQQGKSAVATSSRLPIRNEAQSQITRKRGRDCGNENGEQITSIQNEETDDTKRQKKDSSSSSSSSSSNNFSSSSSHKPTTTATVTRPPQPSNQTSTETAGVSTLDGTIEKE